MEIPGHHFSRALTQAGPCARRGMLLSSAGTNELIHLRLCPVALVLYRNQKEKSLKHLILVFMQCIFKTKILLYL